MKDYLKTLGERWSGMDWIERVGVVIGLPVLLLLLVVVTLTLFPVYAFIKADEFFSSK